MSGDNDRDHYGYGYVVALEENESADSLCDSGTGGGSALVCIWQKGPCS